MADLQKCVEAVMTSGQIDSVLINAEFGGRNLGMDAFQAALKEEGLSLGYDSWRHRREWYISAGSAGSAFRWGLTYRPYVWDVGYNRGRPREDGVEKIGSELVRYEYILGWSVPCRKRAIARKSAPGYDIGEFHTEYKEVPR